MEDWDRLWKDTARLSQATARSQVDDTIDQCLDLKLPWATRLAGILAILHQVLGDDTGVSFYGVTRPWQPLVLVGAAGRPGALATGWGVPVAGIAAQEQAAQFAGEVRTFADYLGGWIGVHQCVAVPVLHNQHLYGVLEVRAYSPDYLNLAHAELVLAVGARIAAAWPTNQKTGGLEHANRSTHERCP
ncbi:MAG: hypothetical protein C7B45_11715 [Sulfobacillus acidophilus]|uniref:GAF domain-containing protein n=1 Tax=Sulfobacillus acidophilus TaxID=53633 RepID=A0A2T2WG51_9FIRM|nr:MAG: hypothetical protein C7B45_11715 [Sulfobacillus acidophilus]